MRVEPRPTHRRRRGPSPDRAADRRRGDPTSARVRSYFCVYTEAGADHWGSYRDDVVLDAADGGWRFARRTVRVTGTAPGSRFAADLAPEGPPPG